MFKFQEHCFAGYLPFSGSSQVEKIALSHHPISSRRLPSVKRYFCRLSYLWVLIALPLAASTARIYVTNSAGTTVQVIDPMTNKVVQTIGEIEVAEAVQFSRDGSQVYVGNRSDHIFVV